MLNPVSSSDVMTFFRYLTAWNQNLPAPRNRSRLQVTCYMAAVLQPKLISHLEKFYPELTEERAKYLIMIAKMRQDLLAAK